MSRHGAQPSRVSLSSDRAQRQSAGCPEITGAKKKKQIPARPSRLRPAPSAASTTRCLHDDQYARAGRIRGLLSDFDVRHGCCRGEWCVGDADAIQRRYTGAGGGEATSLRRVVNAKNFGPSWLRPTRANLSSESLHEALSMYTLVDLNVVIPFDEAGDIDDGTQS